MTVDEIEAIAVEASQIAGIVLNIGTGTAEPIVVNRLAQHGGRDVDAITLLEVRAQCLRQATDSTTEVQRCTAVESETARRNLAQEPINILLSCLEEAFFVPLAAFFVRPGQDGPHRVPLT